MRSKDVLLLHPSHSAHTQATAGLVHWQPYRGMAWMVQTKKRRKQTNTRLADVNSIIYFQMVLFSYGAFLKYLVCLVLIATIF
jgi:hypothetical protein